MACSSAAKKKLSLKMKNRYVILDNGLVRLTILKPQGHLVAIKYGGMDNLLDIKSSESSRGYWDINWSFPGGQERHQLLAGTKYRVIQKNSDLLEVSFQRDYIPSTQNTKLPLSFDIRYVLQSDTSGFYCYAIYVRHVGCRAFDLTQTRMVFRLRQDKFHYMAVSDEKQRIMPMPEDLLPGRSKRLIVPESVLLLNPINPDLKGEVDDKYQYAMDNREGKVYGWISCKPTTGFWVIFPSNESRSGGPTKQNLTVQTGPACLAMFHSTDYIGKGMVAHFREGEEWRKVFGPFFVYLNSTSSASNAYNLWTDAKMMRLLEAEAWPYDFVSLPHYLTSKERGSATGRLLVQDSFISGSLIPSRNAYVGLSEARTEGGWQIESKGYQFWVKTDSNGNFTIKNVIPGVYALHGWVPGFIGNYLHEVLVTISAGSEELLGNLTYIPLRDGPTVWEIGYPDRTAKGFYVPDVNPAYVNKLFVNSEKYRQYGLWDRYTDMHPHSELTFTIGISDPKREWFFAHVDRRWANNVYVPSTWTVKFRLNSVITGIYKLRLAMASAHHSSLKIYVNSTHASRVVFRVMNLGSDEAISRHGIHGLYYLFSVDISSSMLLKGDNAIFLAQSKGEDAICGILYDYVRLECPAPPESSQKPEEEITIEFQP